MSSGITLPEKPAALKVGIGVASLNIALVLAVAASRLFDKGGAANLYLILCLQAIQLALLGGVINGSSKMRWCYIGYDMMQFSLSLLPGAREKLGAIDLGFMVMSAAVWICFCMPAAHAWFRNARAARDAFRKAEPEEYAKLHKLRAIRLFVSSMLGATSLIQLARPLHLPVAFVLVCVVPVLVVFLLVAAWQAWQARIPKELKGAAAS